MLTIEKFNQLIELYSPILYRLAYRLAGNAHIAEDIVQETFSSLWKSRSKYHDKTNPRALLVVILRRRIADYRRAKQFPMTLGELDISVEENNYYTDGLSAKIQAALSQLTPAIREALLLVVVGELTHQEAASVLRVPLGTILSRVNRGRNQLRKLLTSSVSCVSSSFP